MCQIWHQPVPLSHRSCATALLLQLLYQNNIRWVRNTHWTPFSHCRISEPKSLLSRSKTTWVRHQIDLNGSSAVELKLITQDHVHIKASSCRLYSFSGTMRVDKNILLHLNIFRQLNSATPILQNIQMIGSTAVIIESRSPSVLLKVHILFFGRCYTGDRASEIYRMFSSSTSYYMSSSHSA